MRWLAVVIVLASAAEAQQRFQRCRSNAGRSDRGFSCGPGLAFFEFAPASGAGLGSPCGCAAVTGAKGEAVTFTRASVAECYANNGQTLTQCGSGLPRVSSGSALSSWAGLWVEWGALNLLLQNRDLSQAVWTKTTMTCALTATGMRNDTNAASTCTASGANATVCQTITIAAANRQTTWHIKRRTGTGTVKLSRDGATYSADISSQLSSTLWRRAVPWDVPGCAGGNCIVVPSLSSSVLNPQICLQLGTSGDAVDIDFTQDEAVSPLGLPVVTSPILTGAASASRAEESAFATIAPTAVASLRAYGSVGGVVTQYAFSTLIEAWQSGAIRTWINANNGAAQSENYMQCYWRTGVDYPANSTTFIPSTFGGSTSFACDYNGTTQNSMIHGNNSFTTPAAFTPPTMTRIYFGNLDVGANVWNGVIKGGCADPTAGKCDVNTGDSGDVVFIGDSITRGDAQSPTRFPFVASTGAKRSGVNLGITGNTAAQCRANFEANGLGKGYSTLVLLCSVNSINNGLTDAQTWTDLQAIADEARATGMKVILVKTTPWAAYASWSAGKQTFTDNLWTTMLAYCATNSTTTTCVSTDSIGTGSPLQLAAGNNSGDGLHPNAAGGAALGALVQAAIP